MSEGKKEILFGDCLDLMKPIDDNSIDLCFTSPPYAERRKATYGGTKENEYVDWFLPIGAEIKRILKPTGSFFLNIKPHTNKGERSLYVYDLICRLKRETGFMFVEEYCWTKNAFPGSLKGRFKNAFEPIYHFTKNSPNEITFNPVACGTPIKEESIARTYRKQCGAPKNGSGMTGMNTTNIRNLGLARPSNVINVNNVSNQFSDKQLHPATFPEGLVEFFVKSFTNEGDIVLDPFGGSGTVGLTCVKTKRQFILMEKQEQYFELIKKRVGDFNKSFRIYKVIGILPILALLFIYISIIMKSEIIIPLIIATWISISAIILSVNKKTWRGIIIASLSPIICYGILKIYFHFKHIGFNLWKPEEYSLDNLIYFFKDEIFSWSIGINIVSFFFFYLIFPALPKFLFNPIYKIFYKILRIKSQKVKIKNNWDKGEKRRKFWNPFNPKEIKNYDKTKDEEFEYDLHIKNRSISLIIQFLFCVSIFSPFKWIFLIIIIALLGLMIIERPLLRAIIDHEHKE